MVAGDHSAVRKLVLPRDAEIVPVDSGARLEPDPAHLAAVHVPLPPRRQPLPGVHDVERDGLSGAPDREGGLALELVVPGALGEAPVECDLGVVLGVEEISASQMGVALGLARVEAGQRDGPPERGLQAGLPVEVHLAVNVLEESPHQRDHHVAGAELGRGVARLEDPARHQSIICSSFGRPLRLRWPSSVTTTRSSMRTPNLPGM